MKINNLNVSFFDDDRLVEWKQRAEVGMNEDIKTEGSQAVKTIAKRVLEEYWRYFETKDVGTQTEEKVIEALKKKLFALNEELVRKECDIKQLERDVKAVKKELVNEQQMHQLTKKML